MTDPSLAPSRAPVGQARFVGVAASAIAFAITFAWPAFQKVRVLWYYPLERRWAFEVAPEALAMDWFGRTLVSGVGALAVYFAASAIAGRLKPLGPRGRALWTAWMVTAVLIAMALYTHQLVTRRPKPSPLPSWYVPK